MFPTGESLLFEPKLIELARIAQRVGWMANTLLPCLATHLKMNITTYSHNMFKQSDFITKNNPLHFHKIGF
jgi:hypothetical protein